MLDVVDFHNYFEDLEQMGSSDIEFLRAMELEAKWQNKELNRSDNTPVQEMVEGQQLLGNMDLVLTLLHVSDFELPQKDDMKGIMAFNSDLFDRSTVEIIFQCFTRLLEVAVKNQHEVVWFLPMLTQADEQKQLIEWNRTSAPCPKPKWLIHEFFLDQVKANPNAIALIEYGGQMQKNSYGELRSMAEKVARQIRALGVGANSVVGLLMANDTVEVMASIYST